MGKSKTFFFTLKTEGSPVINQIAITRTSDNHWYFRIYKGGEATNKATRANLQQVIELSQLPELEFKMMFGLAKPSKPEPVRRKTMQGNSRYN